jgi:hypothetical protein
MSEPQPKASRRSDDIRARGAEYFDQLIADREEETLHLEFKTLPHDGGQLKRDDRKLIVAAIAGLANAEGGVLVIGIETKRVDGIDVVVAKRLISQLQRTTNLVRSQLPEVLSPQHPAIEVFAVEDAGKKDAGFIVVDVPESDARPHYSNVHHQYFRRGSDGTRVMEHGEVRDLMFARTEGRLELNCHLDLGGSTGDLKCNVALRLALKNVGRIPVSAPYIRIAGNGWNNAGIATPRLGAGGMAGYYTSRDVIVHVQDEISLAFHHTGLDFRRTGQHELKMAINEARRNGLQSVSMKPVGEMASLDYQPTDRPVHVSGFYGAENATVKEFELTIDKAKMLQMFCDAHSIE